MPLTAGPLFQVRRTIMTGYPASARLAAVLLLLCFGSSCDRHDRSHIRHDRDALSQPAYPTSNTPGAPAKVPANNSGLDFGRGFNSLTGEVKQTCIVFSEADKDQPTSGSQQGNLAAELADWTHDVTKQMNMDATASFGFGVYSGDASFSYMSTGHLHRYGQYLFINETLENERQLLKQKKYSLRKEALNALKSGIPAFIDMCGDEFVEGRITGGSLLAILKVDGSTESEQTKAAGSLKAAAYGNTLNVNASQEVNTLASQGRMSFQVARQGPAEDWPSPDVPTLMKYALEYPCKVGGRTSLIKNPDGSPKPCASAAPAPWTQQFLLRGYDELLDRTLISKEQADFYAREAPYVRALYVEEGGLAYIKQHPQQFGFLSTNRVDDERSRIRSEIERVTNTARECARQTKSCQPLTHKDLRPLPNRVDDVWQDIPPRDSNYQPLPSGQVVGTDVKIIEATGWWYANGNDDCTYLNPNPDLHIPAAKSVMISFFNRKTGKTFPFPYTSVVRIPADTDVSVKVGDSVYKDNCTDTKDKVRVRAYTPAFVEDASYPQNLPADYALVQPLQ